jgi:RecA-family ATPase
MSGKKTKAPPAKAVIVCLADVKSRAVRWIDPGRIPLGKHTSLIGDPGVGKSGIALDYAARVSTGREMPDGSHGDLYGKPAGVVILSAEDDPADTIRPRLEAMGGDLSRIVLLPGVTTEDGERMPNLHDVPAIKQAVRRVQAKLVIVDPLMAYLPGGTDSYKDQAVRHALAPLCKLARQRGVALLVVAHLNKNVEQVKAIYRAGGSIGIAGNARSVLLAAKAKPQTEEVTTWHTHLSS